MVAAKLIYLSILIFHSHSFQLKSRKSSYTTFSGNLDFQQQLCSKIIKRINPIQNIVLYATRKDRNTGGITTPVIITP